MTTVDRIGRMMLTDLNDGKLDEVSAGVNWEVVNGPLKTWMGSEHLVQAWEVQDMMFRAIMEKEK